MDTHGKSTPRGLAVMLMVFLAACLLEEVSADVFLERGKNSFKPSGKLQVASKSRFLVSSAIPSDPISNETANSLLLLDEFARSGDSVADVTQDAAASDLFAPAIVLVREYLVLYTSEEEASQYSDSDILSAFLPSGDNSGRANVQGPLTDACVGAIIDLTAESISVVLTLVGIFSLGRAIGKAVAVSLKANSLSAIRQLAIRLGKEAKDPLLIAEVVGQIFILAIEDIGVGGFLDAVKANVAPLDWVWLSLSLTAQLGALALSGGASIAAQLVGAVLSVTTFAFAVDSVITDCDEPDPEPPGGGFFCFSDRSTVQVKGKGKIRMDELSIGDAVLTASGYFSKVYSFGHFDAHTTTTYLQIWANRMDEPLEITPSHMLYHYDLTQKKALIPAVNIKVGDVLAAEQGPVTVTAVHSVVRQGMYDPLTTSGDILVNGIAASNYISLPALAEHVSHETQHWIEHAATAPYRVYCSWLKNGACENETYDETTGLPKVVMFWFPVLRWMEKQGPVVQATFVHLLVVPGHWLVLMLEHATLHWKHLIAAVIGYYCLWSTKKKTSGVDKSIIQPIVKKN